MKHQRAWIIVLLAMAGAAACAPGPSGEASSAAPAAAEAVAPAAKPALPVDPVYDEVAAFLAGRPCAASPYKEFQETEEYRTYAAALEESWAAMEAERLGPIRTWAAKEIAASFAKPATIFYPFGGPDALTPLILFPGAPEYVLLGLEFVGRMPEFQAGERENAVRYIGNLQDALGDFFKKSYFITHNMNEKLTDDKVDGVLPVLCFFLKRSGHAISSIKRLEFSDTGEALESPYPGEAKKRRRPFGIRIAFFSEGSDVLRSLVYVSCDLEDKAFLEDKPLDRYLRGLAFETTFVKSASYLMHYKEFSRIRDLVLSRSRFVLQDDTGIPFRYFPPATWDVLLYGVYAPPVSDFKGVDQPDLQAAFEEPGRARLLPFPLGYHWGTKKDQLLFCVKK